MNRELGPQEAKAIGSGSQPQPQPEHRTKRRMRWRLLLGALALTLAGYGLADAAHSFGWWPPVIDNNETTTADLLPRRLTEADLCMASSVPVDAVVDYANELVDDIGDAQDDLDFNEVDRLMVKRVAVLEAQLVALTATEVLCNVARYEIERFRADWEDILDGLLSACDTYGLAC